MGFRDSNETNIQSYKRSKYIVPLRTGGDMYVSRLASARAVRSIRTWANTKMHSHARQTVAKYCPCRSGSSTKSKGSIRFAYAYLACCSQHQVY